MPTCDAAGCGERPSFDAPNGLRWCSAHLPAAYHHASCGCPNCQDRIATAARKRRRERKEWAARGAADAREEAASGYKHAESRGQIKPYWIELYEQEHEALYAQRDRCVAARLDAYYAEWMAIQEERRAERLAAAEATSC